LDGTDGLRTGWEYGNRIQETSLAAFRKLLFGLSTSFAGSFFFALGGEGKGPRLGFVLGN
jgi:hypothetical protein